VPLAPPAAGAAGRRARLTRRARSAVGLAAIAAIGVACADADPASGDPSTTDVSETAGAVSAEPTAETVVSTAGSAEPTATTSPPATTDGGGVRPDGFALVAATVTASDGTVCELCLWSAQTAAQRGRGLMGVTDLGRADGMAFLYDTPSSGEFYMLGTPMPLSIAFFAPDGTFISSTDMEPCAGPAIDCPRYSADAPFTVAVEVPAGGLDELAIGPGSRIEIGPELDACPVG